MFVDFNKCELCCLRHAKNFSEFSIRREFALVILNLKVLGLDVLRDTLHNLSLGKLSCRSYTKEFAKVATKIHFFLRFFLANSSLFVSVLKCSLNFTDLFLKVACLFAETGKILIKRLEFSIDEFGGGRSLFGRLCISHFLIIIFHKKTLSKFILKEIKCNLFK